MLDRTTKTVQAGRARLQAALPADESAGEGLDDGVSREPEFYDQDSS